MKLTEREQLVVTLLPAVVIVAGYVWLSPVFSRGKPLGTLRQEYAEAEEAAVRPVELMSQRAQVSSLEKQIDELGTEKRSLQSRVEETCGRLSGNRKRIRSLDALTGLFRRHGLAIVEDCPAEDGHEVKLPAAMAEATDRLLSSSQERTGQVRCIHFVGRYMDVLAALEELAGDRSSAAVPVGLNMSEADVATDLRKWSLLVWL